MKILKVCLKYSIITILAITLPIWGLPYLCFLTAQLVYDDFKNK